MADLTEDDIPGAKLDVCLPALQKLKVKDLKFWLQCRGNSCEGSKTKAQIIESCIHAFVYAFKPGTLTIEGQ